MRARTLGFLKHLFLSKKWLKRCFHFTSRIVVYILEGPLGSTWLWPLMGLLPIALILGPVSDHGERALPALTLPFPQRLLSCPVYAGCLPVACRGV